MLVFLIAGSANIACYAAEKEQIDQLQAQMKTFSKRVRVYVRCVKGKCTPAEKKAARKEALKDGVFLAASIVAATGVAAAGYFGWRWAKKSELELPKESEEKEQELQKELQEETEKRTLETANRLQKQYEKLAENITGLEPQSISIDTSFRIQELKLEFAGKPTLTIAQMIENVFEKEDEINQMNKDTVSFLTAGPSFAYYPHVQMVVLHLSWPYRLSNEDKKALEEQAFKDKFSSEQKREKVIGESLIIRKKLID